MKIGYQIQIQKDLSDDQKNLAREYCDAFITCPWTKGDAQYGVGKGPSYFKRNVLGFVINRKAPPEEQIVFRRISKNRRIFGVVKLSLLKFKKYNDNKKFRFQNGSQINLIDGCRCDSCTNFYYVSMTDRPEMEIYYTFGDIKG